MYGQPLMNVSKFSQFLKNLYFSNVICNYLYILHMQTLIAIGFLLLPSSSAIILPSTSNVEDDNNFDKIMSSSSKENNKENEDSSNIIQSEKYEDKLLTRNGTSISLDHENKISLNSSSIQSNVTYSIIALYL